MQVKQRLGLRGAVTAQRLLERVQQARRVLHRPNWRRLLLIGMGAAVLATGGPRLYCYVHKALIIRHDRRVLVQMQTAARNYDPRTFDPSHYGIKSLDAQARALAMINAGVSGAGWHQVTRAEAEATTRMLAGLDAQMLDRLARREPVPLEDFTPEQRELLRLAVCHSLNELEARHTPPAGVEIFGPVRYVGEGGILLRRRLSGWPRLRLRDKEPVWVKIGCP